MKNTRVTTTNVTASHVIIPTTKIWRMAMEEQGVDKERLDGGLSVLLPHGLEHVLHLLPLLLGEVVRSDPLLQELQASLFLTDSEQLLCSPLVGGESNYLTDQVADEAVVLGGASLPLRGLLPGVVHGGLVTLLHTNAHLIAGRHFLPLVEVNQAI